MNKTLPPLLVLLLLLGLPSLQAQPTTVFLGRDAIVTTGTSTITLGDSTGKIRIVKGAVPTGTGALGNSSQLNSAATALESFFEKITGVTPHITNLPGAITNGETRIILGESTGNPITAYPELSQTDSHGFLIKSTVRGDGGTDIHIISKSAVGIRFGALFFLYNYCGVRVIGSGTLGQIYEQRNPILVPNTFYVLNKQPDYRMRYWSGSNSLLGRYLMGDENGERRYDFGHMANHIYHPADYGDTSPNPTPEFYPVISGTTRYPQKDSNGNWPQANWQPTYSESIVTTRAIAWAAAKLVDKPHFESVSLTVNDGYGYSEPDLATATLSDGRVSIGNLFRTYVNAVAASLPTGKSVAFIAYNYTSSPPDQPLASNVMPFMVHEPKVEIPRWDGKMSQCGLYFILYGGGYVIPNHWPHAMQEALQYGYAEGAKAAHGEFYGTWGPDGPKMWVYTNLLWNVDADVDDLLDDYYYHAYGPEAAPFMAEYFERAEAIYSRRKTATRYNFATTFPGEDQFAHATEEDFEVMEEAIADAQSSVVGIDNATRVDRVARCFQLGRMYWDQFQTLRALAASEAHSENDLDDVMALAESFYTQDAARQIYWTEEVAPHTEYCIPAGNDANSANPQFQWNELASSMDAAFREITRYKQSIGETPQEIYDFWMGVASTSSTLASFAETQLLYAANKNPSLTNFVTNPSFEESTTDPIMAAQDWVKEPAGTPSTAMFRDTTEAHSGGASLGIEGTAGTFGVRQRVALFNGRRYRLSFWYKTASPDMSVRYVLHNINGFLPGSVEWKSFDRILTANGNPLILSPLILTMNPGQFASQIWFDDVKVELLAPEGVQGFFEQDFSASTSLSAYKNITNYNMSPNAPTVDRFNDLSTGSGNWAISSGRLRLNRTGTANGGFTRLSGPLDQAPKIQYARFDLGVNLKGAASTDTLANIDFGDFQSVTSYDSTNVSDVSNRLQIKGTGTNLFGLTMNGVTQGSYAANGSSLSITWVINQSDTEEQYEGLDSSPRTVSPNRSDVWVGNTLLFNNVTRPAGLGGNRVGGVRFQTTGTQPAEFSFDNFLFEPVMGAAGLLTQNFAASTSVANYVDASNPSVGEFHDISAESKGGTWTITSCDRFLHLARTHVGPDSDNGAGFMKLNQGFPSQPNVVTAQFDLAVKNCLHVFGTFGYLDFGSFTSLTDYNSTTLTGISNRISIRGGGSHKYRFEYNGVVLPAVGDAFVADGTPTRITWVMNHSGSTQTYRGVDGSLRDLDHHHSDFWVGDTLLFSNAPRLSSLPSGNTSVGAFRFRSTYPDKVDLYFGNFDFQRELPR